MAEQMYIVITIRKPVVDREAGEAVYEIVKTKLAAYTDLAIAATVSNHFVGVKPT